MSDLLISVVIPTYHRNDLLARCLERLAPGRQAIDPSRYEVLVTDDGKTTTAEAMIREQFPWAQWIKGPQRGPAANRNNGAKHARGEWIAFTDDDCVPERAWLEELSRAIRPGIEVYEGKTTCNSGCKPGVEESPINLHGGLLWSCNFMIAPRFYDALGGFDETFPTSAFEDVDFHHRVKLTGAKPIFVSAAMVDHPPRPTRLGAAAGRLWESRVLFIFKYRERTSLTCWLPWHVFRVRLHQLTKIRSTRDWFTVAWSDVREIVYVLKHVYQWETKYKSYFRMLNQSI